ncbi:MAG: hypothetical protein LBC39_07455 [Methanobrevibacter sp.]|jgi:hypothetical protein|nr:hypothetical protein [Candidatus Methanovirga aequatorialis]
MGKLGFTDVPCPNKDCEDYGKIENENLIGNENYQSKNGTVHKYYCKTCSKSRIQCKYNLT